MRPTSVILNVLWIVLGGFWSGLAWLVATAVVLAVTIIGLPFAWAHLKLAGISIAPIGYTIVDID